MKRPVPTTALRIGAALALCAVIVACEKAPATPDPHSHDPDVYATRTFTITSFNVGQNVAVASWTWNTITANVVSEGIVAAHWRYDSNDVWHPLPDVFQWDDFVTAQRTYGYEAGRFYFEITSPSPTAVRAAANNNIQNGSQVRVTIYLP